MPGKRYNSIQNPRQYRALRRQGYSKEAAARISNAATPGTTVKAPERDYTRDDTGKFSEGSGGGGAAKKPPPKKAPAKKPDKAAAAAANRSTVGDVLNENDDERLGKNGLEALNSFGEGKPLSDTMRAGMEKAGLVKTDRDGVVGLTAEGRKVLAAANKGDADAVGRALDDAGKRVAGSQARDAERQAKRDAIAKRRAETAAKKKPASGGAAAAVAKPKKGGGGGGAKKPDDEGAAAIAARQALLDRVRRAAGKSFVVTKDARGRERWAAVSSTAYRDRDGEIVSRKALAGAVAHADAAGRAARGPLRFWHAPGLELGDCDFQAVTSDGRALIESGTFRSPAIAAAVKARAKRHGISIGFTHPADEPDAAGVFHTINIFERSLVPRGRESNPFTRIAIKDQTMPLSPEKLKALELLLGGDLAAEVVDQADKTVKAADAAGVAYKAAEPAAEITVNGVTYTVKAPMPPAEMAEAAMTEAADAAAEMVDDAEGAEDAGEMDDATDIVDLTVGQLKAVLADALEMVIGGMSSKMADMRSQYEAMGKAFGAMQATKDTAAGELEALKASRDALAAQVGAMDARLKELEGDQPTISGGFRASESATTAVAAPATVKAGPLNPAEAAYRAIWGSTPEHPIN